MKPSFEFADLNLHKENETAQLSLSDHVYAKQTTSSQNTGTSSVLRDTGSGRKRQLEGEPSSNNNQENVQPKSKYLKLLQVKHRPRVDRTVEKLTESLQAIRDKVVEAAETPATSLPEVSTKIVALSDAAVAMIDKTIKRISNNEDGNYLTVKPLNAGDLEPDDQVFLCLNYLFKLFKLSFF